MIPLSRCVEIGEESIRVSSEYGNVEIAIQPTGLKSPCLINASALEAITSSLPSDSDIELKEKDSALHWKCGGAKGHLSIVPQDNPIKTIVHPNFPWEPPKDFSKSLLLADSICQSVNESGLYGIMLEPNGTKLNIISSNSASLINIEFEKLSYPIQKRIYIRPPIPPILNTILTVCPKCAIDITPDGIFVLGDWLIGQFPLGNELDHDLKAIAEKYSSSNQVANIDSSAIKKFLVRAKTLAERKTTANIHIRIEQGKLILEYKNLTASSEEYFLAEGLDTSISYSSVALSVEMMMLPLQYVKNMILDYLPESVLVLTGSDPNFRYVIGGG